MSDPGHDSSIQKAPCETTFRAIELAMLFNKMWYHRDCGNRLRPTRVLCSELYCRPQPGWTTEKCWLGLLEAIRSTRVHLAQGILFIYDLVCQYFIHLWNRIGHLLPADLKIDRAIGLFHVHDHKDECFYRFASSFIPGAGVVTGKILESLWSVLNMITPSTGTAMLSYRAEIIDDHASDSNHKKALVMGTIFISYYSINDILLSNSLVEQVSLGSGDGSGMSGILWTDIINDTTIHDTAMGMGHPSCWERKVWRPIYFRCQGDGLHIGKLHCIHRDVLQNGYIVAV